MQRPKPILVGLTAAALCAGYGCGVLQLLETGTGDAGFLGVDISSFDGTRAIPVNDQAKAFETTDVDLPANLLLNASDEVRLVLGALDVSAASDDAVARAIGSAGPRHASVRFRVSVAGLNACYSDDVIGPFALTVVNGVVTVDDDSVRVGPAARSVVRAGKFSICAEAEADFAGVLSVGKLRLEFGARSAKADTIELCHIPPGDPDNAHTITVPESAADAHLDHGDYLGDCDSDGDDSGDDGDSDDDDSDDGDSDDDGDDDDSDDDDTDDDDSSDDDGTDDGSNGDADGDGVGDALDVCPDTPAGATVDAAGCESGPLDSDQDGVNDSVDLCPATPPDEAADATGCSCSQTDEDADGVSDCDDVCPGTQSGAAVDVTGCAVIAADAGPGISVDQVGCVTLRGFATNGTPPYTFSWSAPGWSGSNEQNPGVVPTATTVYTLTVTDMSFPQQSATDTVTVTVNTGVVPAYTIVDIGSLSTSSSYPAGINDHGDVVGFYFTDAFVKRAFLYRNGGMTDIGTLGGAGSNAIAINNAAQVVGESQDSTGQWHAFIWDAAGGMSDLGTLGGPSSVANAINNNGVIVGSSTTGTTTHAFLYDDGVMTDIDTLDSIYSEAYGVNDAGTAVGMYLSDTGEPTALVYNSGNLTDLNPTLLASNRVWAINNSGLLAGHSWGPGEFRSFLNVCAATVDLGVTAGFPQTSVWAVNDAGQMVGTVSTDVSTLLNGFVYASGGLQNLNDVVLDAVDWDYLSAAFGINNAGQITGYGRIDGQFRGFIMTPTP